MIDVELFNYDPLGYMASAEFLLIKHFADYEGTIEYIDFLRRRGPQAINYKTGDFDPSLLVVITQGVMLLGLEKLSLAYGSNVWVHSLNVILTKLERGWQSSCAPKYKDFGQDVINILGVKATASKPETSLAWWLLYYHGMINLETLRHKFKELNSTFVDDLGRSPTFKSSTAKSLEFYLRWNNIDISSHVDEVGKLRVKGLI